jgi:hypothetical protein
MEESQQFKKWQWIRARVIKSRSDSRTESYKVEWKSIVAGAVLPAASGWAKRWQYVQHLVKPSEEAVNASGASLGLIKPADYQLEFKYPENPGWTAEERQKLRGVFGAENFFGEAPKGRLLEKLPVEIRYRYRCDGESEMRHCQLFEDWEVGESWRQWSRRYRTREVLEAAIRETYVDRPKRHDNLYLFIGTHARHRVWMVIGHVQPMHLKRA